MKIIHTADWHLGKNLEGRTRLPEQEQFLGDFVELVKRERADLVIVAGDIYDSPNPPAKAEQLFYQTLKRISENGERLTLVIAGNHDNPERLVAAGPLAMEHGILMSGTPKTVIPVGGYGQHQVVDSGEGYIEVSIRGERAVVLTVPYPSEKRLSEVLYGEMEGEEEQLLTYQDRIKSLFQKLSVHFREDTINLVVSHLFVNNSEADGSERAVQLGGSFVADAGCFPENADYVALGHIHKPQIVPGTGHRVRYSGSPLHYNKSEISYRKNILLIEILNRASSQPKEITVTEIPVPVYKPIEIWKCQSIEEAVLRCGEHGAEDSYVYLEIKTDRYIREDEMKQMKNAKADILEILPVLEPVEGEQETEGSVRSLRDKSFEELFKGFYRQKKGVEVSEETWELLKGLL